MQTSFASLADLGTAWLCLAAIPFVILVRAGIEDHLERRARRGLKTKGKDK